MTVYAVILKKRKDFPLKINCVRQLKGERENQSGKEKIMDIHIKEMKICRPKKKELIKYYY
jgi:hypothetical protein